MLLSMLVAWLIPDVPRSLKEQLKREKALLMDLLLTEEADKQCTQSRKMTTTKNDVVIKGLEEGSSEELPICSRVMLSQSDEELNELRVTNGEEEELEEQSEEEPIASTSDLPDRPQPSTCDSLNTTSESLSKIACHDKSPTTPSGCSNQSVYSIKTGSLSRNREFDSNGHPPPDPSSRAKSRSRTLPPRHGGPEAGSHVTRPSHSTTFTHLDQKVPPSSCELTRLVSRKPSKTKPSESQTSVSDSLDSELASSHSITLPRLPSRPELASSLSTVLPRPPSKPELAGSQSTGLPRPPSKPDLLGSATKGLPPRDPGSKVKGRCQTLPPKYRGADTSVETKIRPSHSTTFTHLSQQIPPSPSDLKRNTPVWVGQDEVEQHSTFSAPCIRSPFSVPGRPCHQQLIFDFSLMTYRASSVTLDVDQSLMAWWRFTWLVN